MAFTSFAADGATVPSPPANGGTAPGFLLELLVADLQWTSVQIAMLGLTASVCAGSDSRMNLRALRHIVQSDASVMQLALRYAANIGLAREQALTLNQLYAELSANAKQIAPLVDVVALLPKQREQLLHLLPDLRRLAATAAGALGSLEPAMRAHLNASYLHDGAVIRQYLGRAARGDLVEAERRGAIAPPVLTQRRQSPRARVNTPCRLVAAGGEIAAVIVDVSRTGLGLSVLGKAPISAGDAVVVQVGERRLEAEVARRSGERVGLKLKRPIALSDPLYRAD